METDGPTGTTEPITIDSLTGGTPDPPRILLTDLLTDFSVLQQQEAADRALFLAVTSPDVSSIRSKLITWLASGKQGMCDLIQFPISVPSLCSDGTRRTLIDYVLYLTGTSLADHVASIQTILPDFEVAYRCSEFELVFCVTRIRV
jgi:hypothetical protein